ncbi:hypothetical protein [Rhizobium johnstonii]|uniref:hypothetical protein n=1 Tax=Rhizobium johnstonii TaxID=3019933 RepID=UPI003F9AFB46
MPTLSATDVFTPNSSPNYTYVDRAELALEQRLSDAFAMKNMAVSVSGPSKSGKTVLLRKVIDPNLLIHINGASLKSADDLWQTILSWMEVPDSVEKANSGETTMGAGASAGGKAGIPFVAEGNATGEVSFERKSGNTSTSTFSRGGLQSVVKEIGGSDFVVFLDDFHYIAQEHQEEIGKNIKAVIENGVKICTASVPHRSDDVVRSNPELRGRLAAVDVGYWSKDHLMMIAQAGFPELNVDLAPAVVQRLADEAFGSPQLMQSLCLNLCFQKKIREPLALHERVAVSDDDIKAVFLQTSTFTDWSSLLEKIHAGPRQRGTERKTFDLVDGSVGDVYRTVLLAMASEPAQLALRYDEILARIKGVCISDAPAGSSVNAALQQMTDLSKESNASAPAIEWNEDVLDFVEPYFLFYLRCSDKLRKLGGI